VPLSPELQELFDAVRAAHPDGVRLDDLAAFLYDKPVSYADVEALIGAFAEIGEDLTAPEPASQQDLMQVLAAARALAVETGQRPSPGDIAARTGLSLVAVQRALRMGRSLGTDER
jgi:hypothetical protein